MNYYTVVKTLQFLPFLLFLSNIFVNSSFVMTPSPSGSSSAIISWNLTFKKTTKKIDNVPHLYLLHCPRVAQTDHDAHQLLSADNPGTIHPIICQLTSKMSRRESTTITTNIHPSFFVSNTLKASSMSLLCSSSALFFCIKATNSCRTNVQHKVKKYTFSFITPKSTVPESSSSISLIISMSSCSVGFWPMDLSTTPSSS